MEHLTYGMVLDMFTEQDNDTFDGYKVMGNEDDYKEFFG